MKILPINNPSTNNTAVIVDVQVSGESPAHIAAQWQVPLTIARNNFVHKSLSCWSLNPFVGCGHACRFCYVPDVSARKLGPHLAKLGVEDPDAEWGTYTFVRPLDEAKFLASLRKAEETPVADLNADGHRAIMLSTTTDAWQVVRHADPAEAKRLNDMARSNVRRALELILEQSTLNVRILTRSPLVQRDFDVIQRFGNRAVLGSSIPTLRNDLAKIYEPGAPAPTRRLDMLKKAKARGIPVYVAIAPTYPECDEADLRATLQAVAELNPLTIFAEPINVRADNAARIARHATSLGITLNTSVFDSTDSWADYALGQLRLVERLAQELGLADRLHLWPDKALGSKKVVARQADPVAYQAWLDRCWQRISEWPGNTATVNASTEIAHDIVVEPEIETSENQGDNIGSPSSGTDSPAVSSMITATLSPADETFLAERCDVVRAGLKATIAVATALAEIYEYQGGVLWKATHGSFEKFCRDRFSIGKSQAYRLRDAGAFVLEVTQSPRGDQFGPVNEKQIRPLLRLPEERRLPVWQSLVAETPAAKLTSRAVAKRVEQELRQIDPTPETAAINEPATPKPNSIEIALETAARFRAELIEAQIPKDWLVLIDGVEKVLRDRLVEVCASRQTP